MDETTTATGPTTLRGVLDAYADAGFSGSFTVMERAQLECHACGATFDASSASMSSLRRMEGASDPDDMLAVVAITCPRCAAQGTVVLGYGPNATAEDGDVLQALRDDRPGDQLPGNSAPGEARGDD
ncbi:MAG: hypothetical protein QM733_20885 [Ilumatobacteraceae bacterium]